MVMFTYIQVLLEYKTLAELQDVASQPQTVRCFYCLKGLITIAIRIRFDYRFDCVNESGLRHSMLLN